MIDPNFEPRIVGFLCRWCSYTGADLAGTSRMAYPANVSVIKVMCSGRVDPAFVLKAFQEGADGVLIAGCHPGDCHYINGNVKTMGRFPLLVKMLEQFGIEPERCRLEWVSASEGEKYAAVVKEMTDQLKHLGPLNWKELQATAK
jgi:F420-non-reducing hydrogenase iron-sulfur subunit